MAENIVEKKRETNFLKQKFNFLLKFLFPKNIFLSLLSGLVWAGLFSVVIYTFATPPTSPYTLGETLNPSCAPGSTNCTVIEPAAYSFSSNNFSGTGGFTTTGTVSGGTLTDGTISIVSGNITSGVDATFSGTGSFGSLVLTTSALGVGYGGTGLASIAAGSVLAANTANTLTAINSTSGTKYLQNVDGTISWGTISSGSYVPYTGATANVDLGAYNFTTTGLAALGSLIVDTTTLVANATGYADMVGIGTATPSQALDLIGALELQDTTSSTTGVIYKEANSFLHNFHHPTGSTAVPIGQNTFVGELAGNFTMGSTATQTHHASYSVGVGYQALQANTTGYSNTANGAYALRSNTTGGNNTAYGYIALYSNTTGGNNTANGMSALYFNTTGGNNTANGMYALCSNTTGYSNTANGAYVLLANTTGGNNTANGMYALYFNTTGGNNTANGMSALYSSKTGSNGTAFGYESQKYANDTATSWTNYNTSVGYQALRGSTTAADNTGNYNTALGYGTLLNVTSGGYNTAIGYNAGQFIADGSTANTTSDYSVYLGSSTKASADDAQNEIVIGYDATGLGSNSVVLGNSSITTTALRGKVGIGDTDPTNAELVVIGGIAVGADALNNTISTGSLGDGTTTLYVGTYTVDTTAPSDIITKEEIISTNYGLKDLLKLSVKDYKYKKEYVNEGAVQEEHTGLIAQDVEQIYPEAVIYRSDGLKAVNYTKMIPLIISSIQELSVGKTLSDNGTWGEGTVSGLADSSFATQLKSAFTSLGIYIEKGVATFEEVIAQKATIKTAKVEGLEMIDKTTGEIWCTQISNGEWTKTKGECNAVVVVAEEPVIETPAEEPIVETPTEETPAEEPIEISTTEESIETPVETPAEETLLEITEQVTQQITEQITETVQQATHQAEQAANQAEQAARESERSAQKAKSVADDVDSRLRGNNENESGNDESEAGNNESESGNDESEITELTAEQHKSETVEPVATEQATEQVQEQTEEPSVGDLIQETTAGLFSGVMNFIKWLFGSVTQTVSGFVPGDVKQSTASLSSTFTDNFMQGIGQIINDVKSILKF
ncbi:MAG: tail fiber domain-containing protein [Bacteroidales bacterium]|jgi:hypothetical protein